MTARILISMAALTCILSGCGYTHDGQITSKIYNPPRTYVTYQYVSFPYGGGCMVPRTNYVPESWGIWISNWRYSSKDDGFVETTEYIPVCSATFDICQPGGWYYATSNQAELNAVEVSTLKMSNYPPGWAISVSPEIADKILLKRSSRW